MKLSVRYNLELNNEKKEQRSLLYLNLLSLLYFYYCVKE